MKKVVSIIFLAFAVTLVGVSQSVGLVLSGGGAKGLAHIGVIKALEEYDIPIDYITGTSAGAIVGALYASGYSVDEMIDAFKSGVMDKYLTTSFDNSTGYLSKEMSMNPSWFKFKFNLDSTFTFNFIPSSVIPSNNIDFGMIEFFSQSTTACKGNFDDLMVKFRCVASSVNDNKPYVFRSGDLDVAVRSSMAFPFLFSPVQVNDKVLLDGGMYDNFPIDVMTDDFNPDVIIGSTVSTNYDPASKDDIISVIQNVFMMDMDFSMPDNGILVRSNVLDVGLLDFDKVDQLVDSGYNACLEKIPQILEKIDRKVDYQTRKDIRDSFNHKKPPFYFENIIADNVNINQQKYIEVMLARKHKLLSPQEINSNYSVLLSDDIISSVTPSAKFNDSTGYYDLHLMIKKNTTFQAELGGNLSVGGPSEYYLGFLARGFDRYSWNAQITTYLGSFYKSLGLTCRIDYPAATLLYCVVDAGLNSRTYQKTFSALFIDDSPLYLIQNESHALLQFGHSLARRADMSMDIAYLHTFDEFYNTNSFTENDDADEEIFNGAKVSLGFVYNTLNDKLFPTYGTNASMKYDYIYGSETYNAGTTSLIDSYSDKLREWLHLKMSYDKYFKLSKILSFGMRFQGEISNQELWGNYISSILHASTFEPFSDASVRFIEENRAYNYAAAGINLTASLPYNLMIKAGAYTFAPFYPIKESIDQQVVFGDFYERQYYMFSLNFILKNSLAPISLNFNFYDSKSNPFSITLDIGYILFNRRALD